MKNKLELKFTTLENARRQLFNALGNISNDVLNKKPMPDKWSVAEIIVHLITSEEMSLKYLLKKTLDTTKERPEGLKNKWNWILIKTVFALNIKFKAPEIVEPQPGYHSLKELEARWLAVRTQTHELLEKLKDEELDKTLWKHALAGKLNLNHMLQFYATHIRHHQEQIERTLKLVQ